MSGRAVFLWVVIPFVALSVLALWLTRDTPAEAVSVPTSPPPVTPRARPTTPPAPEPPVAEPPRPPPPREEPVPEPPPGTWDKEEVRVALRSIQPLVRSCLLDASVRHPGPHTVKLRFTLEARGERGGFGSPEVVESTVQDPFVHACLVDALADTQFSAPPGKAPLTLTHPFEFRPGKNGGP
ncbi:MAG TPA: AgmX/PglI C-terminal domain-containing protein [Archangium sp.]|uniref:AgmX/PglI C-terminal domain-containing protein n=1 Tax=Archangium sp. TaxID=1872627 RepID=UPI002EDA858F